MSLFALVKAPVPAVYRLPVTRQLGAEIETLFREQEGAFIGEDTDVFAFDGRYRPEDHELLEIEGFAEADGIDAAIRNPIDVPVFTLTDDNVGAVAGLVFGYVDHSGPRALIQVFDKRRAMTSRGFTIWHANDVFRRWQGVAISLDAHLAAILSKDRLQFRSFFQVRRLFDMTAYYREATDADLKAFEGHERVCTVDGFALADIADGWIRRRVGLISESGILDHVSPRRLAGIAARFDLELQVRRIDGREEIEMPMSRKEVKRLLKFLDEDYYESALSDAKYVTNSKRRID